MKFLIKSMTSYVSIMGFSMVGFALSNTVVYAGQNTDTKTVKPVVKNVVKNIAKNDPLNNILNTPLTTIPLNNSVDQSEGLAPSTVKACLALDSNPQRLDCYDASFKREVILGNAVEVPIKNPLGKTARQQTKEVPVPDEPWGNLFTLDSNSNTTTTNQQVSSLLDRRWELSQGSKLGVFNIRPYQPIYVLPAFISSNKNDMPTSPNPNNQVKTPQNINKGEAKIQLSLKTKAIENIFGQYGGDVWVGYTQSSRWQVYTPSNSRPFRETNYEPEVSLILKPNLKLGNWDFNLAGVTLNHQSNGREDPLSRSWNRFIVNLGIENGGWVIMARPWYRLKETANNDNNPDIESYLGHGDLQVVRKFKAHEFSVLLRQSFDQRNLSRGAVQFDWNLPIKGSLRGHVQIFNGYGESLIDYNHRATYVGLGISLVNNY